MQSNDFSRSSNVVVVGITGSGKSTVGRHLSVLLGMGFLDLDDHIEHLAKKTVSQLFDEGEGVFREWEVRALASLESIRSHVIALGGGALQDDRCLRMARSLGPLVWLKPSADEVARRLYMRVQELEKRPMFKDLVAVADKEERRGKIRDRIAALTDQRSKMYQAADIVLDGGFVTPETSACQLKEILLADGFTDFSVKNFSVWQGSSL